MPTKRRLAAVLHSIPHGSGARTLGRVDLARAFLRCETYDVVNLYPALLPNTNTFPVDSTDPVWAAGRSHILDLLDEPSTAAVLLGYGVSPPVGAQRRNYLDQVEWLTEELRARSLDVWVFGERTTHPSRWHRHVHKHAPGTSMEESLKQFLTRYKP